MSFGLSESRVVEFKQAQTQEQDTEENNEIGQVLETARFRERRMESHHPISEHVGPFYRNLNADLTNPGHQREICHCSGGHATCPAHFMEEVEDAQSRLELLSASKAYLEQHIATSEDEVKTIRGKVTRASNGKASLVVIPISENKFYVITSARVGGVARRGEGRIDRWNRQIDEAAKRSREKGQSLLRFNHEWPSLEKPPRRFERIASSPDTIVAEAAPEAGKTPPKAVDIPAATSEEEVIALTEKKLRGLKGVALEQGITFGNSSKGIRIIDFWISLEVLADSLKHCHIHLALGYHLSSAFYARAKKWAEEKLAERANKQAA